MWVCGLLLLALGAQAQQADTVLTLRPDTALTRALWPQRMVAVGGSMWQYSGSYAGTVPQAGIFLAFKTNKARYINTRFEAGLGQIMGFDRRYANNDPTQAGPAPSFQTSMLYMQAELNLNLIKTSQWLVYASAGIGLLRFDVRDGSGAVLNTLNSSRQLGETYNTTTTWLPLGLGGAYFLPNGLGAGMQLTWQNPATRYLDNTERLAPANDQVLSTKLSLYIPLADPAPRKATKPRKRSSRASG